MENATKALLIAAAVLIAIVLIAIGVGLLSQSKSTTNQAGELGNQISSSATNKTNEIKNLMNKL